MPKKKKTWPPYHITLNLIVNRKTNPQRTKYVNRLKNYFAAYNIEDDKQQKAMLLTFVEEQMNVLIDQLPFEQTTPEKMKHTLLSSSWPCKTNSTQWTTPNITDLCSEKKTHPQT